MAHLSLIEILFEKDCEADQSQGIFEDLVIEFGGKYDGFELLN